MSPYFFFLHAYIVPLPMFYMYMYHVTVENKAVFHLIYRYKVLRESWRSLENMQKKQRSRIASVFAHQHLCCSLPI